MTLHISSYTHHYTCNTMSSLRVSPPTPSLYGLLHHHRALSTLASCYHLQRHHYTAYITMVSLCGLLHHHHYIASNPSDVITTCVAYNSSRSLLRRCFCGDVRRSSGMYCV
eukprot:GFYU01015378.1.p2 GENE.GFYU01015378.1~~GFYU01015378.1.p2  ORF type:complete len:111 (-),score=10.67 GFYU01015378.1:14-346(-)